jgi:hypothetical protein
MNLLFAAASEMITFDSALLMVVLAGLLVLAKMVFDLRAEVNRLRSPSPTAPAPQSPAPPVRPVNETIPPDVLTAIVSAIHFTLGENHHVVSISPVESMMWSREGRRSIFDSHTVR